MKLNSENITRFIFVLLAVIMLYSILTDSGINITWFQSNMDRLEIITQNHLIFSIISFLILRYFFAVISVPGSGVLSIVGGAIFNFWLALLLALFSISLGTLTMFLLSRYALKNLIMDKFPEQFEQMKKSLEEYGPMLLFLLRISGVFPSFVINSFFALTPIKTITFLWISLLGNFPGIIIFVNAGSRISEIEKMGDLLTPHILLSLFALGLLPMLSKFIHSKIPIN